PSAAQSHAAVSEVFRRWMSYDVDGAIARAGALADPSLRDAAYLPISIMLSERHPDQAVFVANGIRDEEVRQQALKSIRDVMNAIGVRAVAR
ncbi:MAG: hypothetical protein ACREIA_18535, partial [Opitutaceae bacterium]